MEVLKQRSPERIFIQDRVGEADGRGIVTGYHRELASCGLAESMSPHLLAVGDDVAVEVGIQVRTSVVASPAIGMESRDAVGIAVGGVEVLHSEVLVGHIGLLIDPGIGTVRQPAAGPSKGQVPQVALDEQAQTNPSEFPMNRDRAAVPASLSRG